MLALQRGESDVARELAMQAWHASASEGSKGKRKKPQLYELVRILLTLLLATGSAEQAALARAQLARVAQKGRLPSGYLALAYFLNVPGAQAGASQAPFRGLAEDLELLCVGLVSLFLGETPHRGAGHELQRRCANYRAAGAHWLAAEAEGVLARMGFQTLPLEAAEATASNRALLVDLYKPEAPWERSLSLLEQLAPMDGPSEAVVTSPEAAERRLTFLVRIVSREVSTADQRSTPAHPAPCRGADASA